MAKTSGPLFSEDAHGTVGKVLTYSKRKTVKQVRYQRKQEDVESAAQLVQRQKYKDGIAAWKALSEAEKAIYNQLGNARGLTGFNYFLSIYLITPTPPPVPNPNLKLLCHFNGPDGATTYFSDDINVRAASFFGTAQLDVGIKKFGSAALQINGGADKITFPDSGDWAFGNGLFTIDFWAYFVSIFTEGNNYFYHQNINADNNILVFYNGPNDWLYFIAVSGGASQGYYRTTNPVGFSAGNFYHIEYVRSGSSFYIFKNGVSQALTQVAAIGTIPNLAVNLSIGGTDFNGRMDELRVLKGQAAHTADFTPKTTEYTIYE